MLNDYFEWLTFVGTNLFDGISLFIILDGLLIDRSKLAIKPLTRNERLFAVRFIPMLLVFALTLGTGSYLFQTSHLMRIFGIASVWSMIKFVTKENIRNTFVLHASFLLIVMAIQSPFIFLFSFFSFEQMHYFLIVTGLTTCIAWGLSRFVSLHSVFLFIKKTLSWLNLIMIVVCFAIITLAAPIFFDGDAEYPWLLVAVGMSSMFYIAIKNAIKYEKKSRREVHDVNNILEGVEFLLNSTKSREEMKKDYEETLRHLGFEIPESSFVPGEDQKNIINFINKKQVKRKVKAPLLHDIRYYYTHDKVPLPIMIQMLGTLLDNAIETKTKKPILIKMIVRSAVLEISVSNASEKKTPTEIAYMFNEGITTKEGVRGFGLANLKHTVESYGGEIITSCIYNDLHKDYYLTFKIVIKS